MKKTARKSPLRVAGGVERPENKQRRLPPGFRLCFFCQAEHPVTPKIRVTGWIFIKLGMNISSVS